MINLINSLETCWHLSAPWGKEAPPILVRPMEKVYTKNPKIVGYCCGIEWINDGWKYSITSICRTISVPGNEITVSGEFFPLDIEQPHFKIGELVKFRCAEGSKIRTIVGLQVINGSWFYKIEWQSPALAISEGTCDFPKFNHESMDDASSNPNGIRFAWVTQFDLAGV